MELQYQPEERGGTTTAERVDAYVRRQALWGRLLELFRTQRPNDEQLSQVSLLAEVAIDQVFAAHRLTPAQRETQHGKILDYAECAALYGYVLGYWQARQEVAFADPAALAASVPVLAEP